MMKGHFNSLSTSKRWVFSIIILASCFLISEFFLYSLWGNGVSRSSSITNVITSTLWKTNPLDHTSKYTEDWIKYQSTTVNSPYFSYALQYFNLTEFDPFSRISGINVWDLFPPEFSCPDVQRVGNVGEGGKWVCGLSWLRKQIKSQPLRGTTQKCIIYSYGVSVESSFEQHILSLPELNCEIFAFDPTVAKPNLPSDLPVTFHKQAIWNTTGATNDFLVTEHLFDTMNRLNHSYIDILKIDVEGSEWPVFRELLLRARQIRADKSHGDPSWTLPFGQLLIELHYQDTSSVVEFFTGLAEFGMYPFSREINLQPCLDGRLPFAVEYSFIHSSFFDGLRRNSLIHPMPPVVTPSWFHKPSAVIYFLTQRRRLVMMGSALQSLYHAFYKQFPHYPILIFHDDLTTADQKHMQSYVPHMKLTFIEIVLDIPKHLRPPYRPAPLPRVPHCSVNSSTIGYRHMIMFHSTWVHKYLFNPAHGYSDVQYILRLDDDSSFSAPIGYDIFKMMEVNKFLYGFVSTLQDDPGCVKGLWNFTWDFLSNSSSSSSNSSIFPFSSSTISKYHITDENLARFRDYWVEGDVFYNNFELSHSKIWKTPFWNDFMTAIDYSGGVYDDRWGDAPIHTIYVVLSTPINKIHAFSDLPYRHDPFLNRVGSGLPHPSISFFETGSCVYYSGWRCHGTNSSNSTQIKYLSGGPLTPAWGSKSIIQKISLENIPSMIIKHPKRLIPLSLERESLPFLTNTNMKKSKKSENNVIELTSRVISSHSHSHSYSHLHTHSHTNTTQSHISGVLFTFGHVHKYQLLGETINNFYLHYVKDHPCPIVVFHFSNFNSSLIQLMKSTILLKEVANMTQFLLVDHSYLCIKSRHASNSCLSYTTSTPPPSCLSNDFETLGASRFLVQDALTILHQMGYDWTFRISDRSLLSESVKYNLFEYLHSKGMRYGYKSVVSDNPKCITQLWNKTKQICNQTSSCSSFFHEWTEGIVVFTNFEISHYSIWQSPLFHHLLTLPISDEDYEESLYWSDPSLHTIAVITSLAHNEIHKFDDIPYTLVSHSPSEASSSLEQTLQVLPSIATHHFDLYFHPQRFGWLGGDIGSSFILPPLKCIPSLISTSTTPTDKRDFNQNSCSEEVISSRSIWLFGDSLIGISSPSSRIEAEFIFNSVGIIEFEINQTNSTSPLPLRTIKRSKYYWGSTSNGVPSALFQLKEQANINQTALSPPPSSTSSSPSNSLEYKYWPYDGISIILPDKLHSLDSSPVNILVIGQVVTSSPSSTIFVADLLSFSISHSLGYLVTNPYESPDIWEYESISLPRKIVNRETREATAYLNWIAIADTKQKSYTTLDDFVYLLGSYDKEDPLSFNLYDIFQLRMKQRTQILAMVTVRDLLMKNFKQCRILMTSSPSSSQSLSSQSQNSTSKPHWVPIEFIEQNPNSYHPHPILPGNIAEGSLKFNKHSNTWTITSLETLDPHIRVCSSATHLIEDDWSCVHVSGINPKWKNHKKYLTYAGKSHPEFLSSWSSSDTTLFPSLSPSSPLSTSSSSSSSSSPQQDSLNSSDHSSFSFSKKQQIAIQSNPFHGVLSYLANPISGPQELFNEFDRETYCPSFVYF